MEHLRTLVATLFAVLLAACSTSEPVQLNTVKEGKPALWKVTGTKPEQLGSAYLFGTIHLLPKNVQWRTPLLEKSIAESDNLIIEVLGLEDTQAAAKIFSKLAVSTKQPEVEQRIKPSLRDELDVMIENAQIPEFALNRMETWAAALSLASAQTTNLGLSSAEGVDKKLAAQFRDKKKPINGLETIEQQLGYFDQLPENLQREMLMTVVEEAANSKTAFEELFNAWMTGDELALTKLSAGGLLEDPKIKEKLLVARNQNWAEQLDGILKKPGNSFIAVGAAHLVGPDSLQSILETRGYKIEKIQ
ncbi:MAG: TraB/GumN family protein [Parasphingorhabdus sp.]